MAVERPVVAHEIRKRLSDAELAEITASLWPVDCQTCGKKLGDSRPSLAVDDVMVFASASLHHGRCRASEWSENTMVGSRGQAMLSFATFSMLIPMGAADDAEPTYYPALIVNPGLEMVFIQKDKTGRWRVQLPKMFAAAGLAPPGGGLLLNQPVPGAVARTPRDAVAVTLESPPFPTYDVGLQDVTAAKVREAGGVLVIATHALHPHQITDLRDLDPVTRGDRTLIGWVELESVRVQRPKTPTAKTGVTFVLHYSPRHLSVGPLLAHTSDDLIPGRAQQWATGVIAEQEKTGAEYLLDWDQTRGDDPGAGWYTLHAISANQYLLRRYPDGWRLVQGFSRADGPVVETENEARAWAAGVVEHKARLTGLSWRPGPTPDGALTLYAEG